MKVLVADDDLARLAGGWSAIQKLRIPARNAAKCPTPGDESAVVGYHTVFWPGVPTSESPTIRPEPRLQLSRTRFRARGQKLLPLGAVAAQTLPSFV